MHAGEVAQMTLAHLQRELGDEQGLWLAGMARGEDGEVVTARIAPKSIGCGKSFRAHLLLTSCDAVRACECLCDVLTCVVA